MSYREPDERATEEAPALPGGAQQDADGVRRHVLERDEYTCQLCGSQVLLHVHHIEFRSHGGRDEPENLLTLCVRCHERVHAHELAIGRRATHVRELASGA